jgi:phosphatidate cytidylyltransferase
MGSSALLSTMGVFYVGLPAVSLIWFRNDPLYGLSAVLLILVTVWATDTGAYFAGRMIGGPRLWPRISPNKTWSGLIGGVSAAGIAAAALAALMTGGVPVGRAAFLGVVLGLVSQAGDLAESALKRERGVKDASGLIPGHGGFMDRVDGLVVAATVAAAIALATNPIVPARALLFGH